MGAQLSHVLDASHLIRRIHIKKNYAHIYSLLTIHHFMKSFFFFFWGDKR